MKAALLGLVLITNLLIFPVVLVTSSHPVVGDAVVVVAPPWQDSEQVIASAGGRLIGPIQAPLASMSVLVSEQYLQELYQDGAWFVFNGKTIAAICGLEVQV